MEANSLALVIQTHGAITVDLPITSIGEEGREMGNLGENYKSEES